MRYRKVIIFLIAASVGGLASSLLIGGLAMPVLVALMFGFIWTYEE